MIARAALAALALCLSTLQAPAQADNPAGQPQQHTLPAFTTAHVTDLAGVLTEAENARIAAALRAARDDPGVEIAVLTISRIADYRPGPEAYARIEDFAKAVFNAWGIGNAARNDGVLILVVIDERQMRIALGAAYPVIYDGRAQRVIDVLMLPEFRNGNYAAGIEAGIKGALDHLVRPLRDGHAVTGDLDVPTPGNDNWIGMVGMATVLGSFVLIFLLNVIRPRDILDRRRRCPQCGKRGRAVTRIVTTPATTTHAGSGTRRVHCNNCGRDDDVSFSIPRPRSSRSSTGGGGGGGFGGGSSSGGGATGKW